MCICVCRVEGFKEAAEKFEQEAGISSPLKLNTLGNRIKVIEAVQSGKMQEAITLINQLYPGLLDDDRDLYFHLQVSMFTLHMYILFYSNKILVYKKLDNKYLCFEYRPNITDTDQLFVVIKL